MRKAVLLTLVEEQMLLCPKQETSHTDEGLTIHCDVTQRRDC